MGIYIKSNINVRKTPTSRTMNLKLCKFPLKKTHTQKVSSKKLGTSRASYAFALYKQDLVMDIT